MQTTIFNLIILDESGSMRCMLQETISGCNEVLDTIRHSASETGDDIQQLVSIYAFQKGFGCGSQSRYLIKNQSSDKVKDVTVEDYKPSGMTPLLDAIGDTLTELKTAADTHEDSTGIVTIMTDGMENASTRYTYVDIAKLISSLKEIGWTINLIGANINVARMAALMDIDAANSMEYTQTSDGTKRMWLKLSRSISNRVSHEQKIKEEMQGCILSDENEKVLYSLRKRKNAAKDFFKENDDADSPSIENIDADFPFSEDNDALPF